MKKRITYTLIMFAFALVLVAVDMWTKVLASTNLMGQVWVLIPNFLCLTYVENTGAAFGMFSGNTTFLIIFTIVFIVVFLLFDIFNHSNNIFYRLGYILVFSGAIGNFIDRICFHYVRDFISMQIFPFVFNMADVFITVGVGLLMVYIVFYLFETNDKPKGKEKKK